MQGDKNSSNFLIGNNMHEDEFSHVPECFLLPISSRPGKNSNITNVPIIDLSLLSQSPLDRSLVVEDIGRACRQIGFFHVVNHGIFESIMEDAMTSASDFFDLPMEEKTKFLSNDVNKSVRYGTSLRDGVDKVQFWRVFLKHYSHPLEEWIESWPANPPNYREKMGRYAVEVRKVALQIMGAITESLRLGPSYLNEKLEDGIQVMAVNCYPPCPKPNLVLGLPPHSDYSCMTILLQSCPGLEVMTSENHTWGVVPNLEGALLVHVGDHLEVLSNGLYKSGVHRATLNSKKTRISIASFHSLAMDEKMETAKELIDEENPKGYKESSFRDFLKFLSTNDITEGRKFIDTLKN